MNRDASNDNAATELSRQQMSVVTQLVRAVSSMRTIDELLQWLAYAIARGFNISVTQCWLNAINPMGQRTVQLRAMHQNALLQEQIVVNEQVVFLAQQVINEQRNFQTQLVTNLFPSYQAILLRRHNLNYCAGCFLNTNTYLPVNTFQQERFPVVLVLAMLLFTQQSPDFELVPTVGSILNQAIGLAVNQRLVLPITLPEMPSFAPPTPLPPTPSYMTPPITSGPPISSMPPLRSAAPMSSTSPVSPTPLPLRQEVLPPFTELIPRRKQDANVLLTSNPFASAPAIRDKQARRLHAAIDGRSNVAMLSNITGMAPGDVSIALKKLLLENRIELYASNGQLVDASLFLNNG